MLRILQMVQQLDLHEPLRAFKCMFVEMCATCLFSLNIKYEKNTQQCCSGFLRWCVMR